MNRLSLLRPLTRAILRRDIRHAFRRVCWVGDVPHLDASRPVVAYSNHNNFYDGHLLWLACREVLDRSITIWMREWDRFPLFAPEGVLPFPLDDAGRRARTIKRTSDLMSDGSPRLLAYFPSGELIPPEHPLPDFDVRTFRRLDRIMHSPIWIPLGIHITWWGENHPTALLTTGPPADTVTGNERDELRQVLESLSRPNPVVTRILGEGRRGPDEHWNLSFTRKLFE